mgnify:CR=1 FL=1
MPWRHVRTLGSALALSVALGVSAGPSQALDRLEFRLVGQDAALDTAIRGASLLFSLQKTGQIDPQDLLAAARADYARILAALYDAGHYSVVIRISVDGREASSIPPLEVPASISTITVRVDPGPPFRFGSTAIAPLARGTILPKGFAPGQPAESGLVGDALDAAVLGWREAGHAKAFLAGQDVVADHANTRLDVGLQLSPGPKLRFGPLAVKGESRMRELRIIRIAGLPTGEGFSETDLRRAEDRLRRTGIFSSVTLTEDDQITAPDLLGITATVVEQKPRRYSLGAEIASLDGMSVTGSWLHRNLMGGGERLRLDGSVSNIGSGDSGVDYALGLALERPATFTPDTTAGLTLGFEHLDEADYWADTIDLGLTLSHVFSDRLTARAGLGYATQDGSDPGGDFAYRNLSLPIGLTWDRRDDSRDPTRGFYLDATVMPFLGFQTTDSGTRLTFDARAYRSLGGQGRLVLAFRAQGGAVFGSDLLDTPRDLLFFSGGGGTVRGQPYRSLGVSVQKGMGPEFQIGGQYFLAGSLELRAGITDRIGIVAFVDMGSIGIDGVLDGSAGVHSGAGIGLRYATGLGPIRLDLAAPVGGSTGDGVQVYIGLGQAF